MAAVTICSDFGAQENKVCHCFHFFFPIYSPWSDGTGCHDLSFLNVEQNSTFFKASLLLTFCISHRSSQSDNPHKLGDSRPGYRATWLQLSLKIVQKKRIQDLHYSDPFNLPKTKRPLTTSPFSFPQGRSSTVLEMVDCCVPSLSDKEIKLLFQFPPKLGPLIGCLGISLHFSLLQERGGLEDFSDTRLPGTPCHRAMPQSHLIRWLGCRISGLWWRTGKSLT